VNSAFLLAARRMVYMLLHHPCCLAQRSRMAEMTNQRGPDGICQDLAAVSVGTEGGSYQYRL
jgi:hypothetical protein